MKRALFSILVITGLLLAVQPVFAVTFTMSPEQIQALYQTYENPDSSDTVLWATQTLADGAKFIGNVKGLQEGDWAQIQLGANFWGIPYGGSAGDEPTNVSLGLGSLAGFDSFALNIGNENENPWMYNLYFNVGYTDPYWGETNYYIQNTWTEIANGSSANVELDFTNAQVYGGTYNGEWLDITTINGLNLAHVTNIGLSIGGNMPLGSDPAKPDYTFETTVTPVPEPMTMLLFGPALLGLIGLKRRKS